MEGRSKWKTFGSEMEMTGGVSGECKRREGYGLEIAWTYITGDAKINEIHAYFEINVLTAALELDVEVRYAASDGDFSRT